jgi:hypothetical protein
MRHLPLVVIALLVLAGCRQAEVKPDLPRWGVTTFVRTGPPAGTTVLGARVQSYDAQGRLTYAGP